MTSRILMDREDEAENFYMIRRFSDQVRTKDEPLARSFVAKVDSDVERERRGKYHAAEIVTGLFGQALQDPNHYEEEAMRNITALESRREELQVTWVEFTKKLKLSDDAKPNMNTVRVAIQQAQVKIQRNQESKIGRTKAFFGSSFEVLNEYNYLFDMLPTGDKYTSVFTGALTAIVKATATHDKITSEISDAFDEISDQVRTFWYVVNNDAKSAYINLHIALFYYELFGFMIRIMREWLSSSWKRFSRSLGNSFLDTTVRGTLQTLRKYIQRVEAESQRRQQQIDRRKLDRLGTLVEHLLINQGKDKQQRDRDVRVVLQELNKIQQNTGDSTSVLSFSTQLHIALPQDSADFSISKTTMPSWTRATMMSDVEHLKPYLQATHEVHKLIDLGRSVTVSTEISVRVYKWAKNSSSEVLWLEGPAGVTCPGQATLTSAFMLRSLRQIEISVIAYFIQPNIGRAWNPEKALQSVIYALIYQAAHSTPQSLQPQLLDLDFATPRFKMLDGTTETLPEALKLLADLLSISPSLQFCIIDGLQLFDGRHMSLPIRRTLRDLISLLCDAVEEAVAKERVFKVLLTTEGGVEELARWAGRSKISRERFDEEEEEELLIMPVIM